MLQKILAVLDGYKRVLVIVAFVGNAMLELATGHSYAHVLNLLFGALGWGDLAGAGVNAASAVAAATVLWAVIEGIAKARAARAGRGDLPVNRFLPPVLVLALIAVPSHAEMRLSALAGGLVSLQGAPSVAAPADASPAGSAAVTPLVSLAVEADLSPAARPLELNVLADLTALPGEKLDPQDPATIRAVELALGLSQPLGSLYFAVYAEAGFATRLPGETRPRDRTARWAAVGLRFKGQRAWLQVGIGPDQRLGDSDAVNAAELAAELDALHRDHYQVAVQVRGALDITSLGQRGRVALVGSAVLGLDLSRRWATLDGGRNDVVRIGVGLGL